MSEVFAALYLFISFLALSVGCAPFETHSSYLTKSTFRGLPGKLIPYCPITSRALFAFADLALVTTIR